ncbi:uncharacterized protein [Antedon mediterranea]|uniref:uncharacterized protein n=1 Tax=Antedon mediterranea TaxID=105859 RepID=UPI003AF5D057
MDNERTGIISEADRVVLRRVISRPSPRRATLGFGISQILLGLIIIAISFTAFAMSTSNRIRNACPYWAGFSVLLTGGVGLIAWKQPSSLAVTFFTFLSAICVILHLVGAVLSGDSGALLNTFKRCAQENELISNSCLCCQDSHSCGDENNSVVFEGISDCSAIRQLLKYLMYMMCGANITACIVSFIATVIGCIYFVRKHTSRRLVLQRSQANNTTQDTYYNDFVDPIFTPPSVPPPPYSPPEYTAIANDPVVMERNEFIEGLTINSAPVGTNVMPPPYSTLDWPRGRQRETHDLPSNASEEPIIQESIDIMGSTDTSSSHSPSPAEEAYLAYCQEDSEENAPLPPQRWDSHHIMGSFSSSLNEQFSNMSMSSLDDRLRRIEQRYTSLDRSSPDDFRSRRRRRREDRRRVRSGVRINSSSSASPELGETHEYINDLDDDLLNDDLQITTLENNVRTPQLVEGRDNLLDDSIVDRGFFSAIVMSSNDHSQSPITSQGTPPVLKRSSATQTSLESFVIENLSGSPPRRRSQEVSPPNIRGYFDDRTKMRQSSRNRGSNLTSSDIDPGLGSSPPSGVESSPSFPHRKSTNLSIGQPELLNYAKPAISGAGVITAKEHLQVATASSKRASVESAGKGNSPKKIGNSVPHTNRKLSTNSQRTKRLHRLRPRAVCSTSSDDDYMESDRVYPRYLVAKLANGVIKSEVHSQEADNNSHEQNNEQNVQSPVRIKLRQRKSSDKLQYLRKRSVKSIGIQEMNVESNVENPVRLRPNDRKAMRRRRRSESLDYKGMRHQIKKVPLQARSRRFSQPNYTANDYNPWILRSDVGQSVSNLNTNHNNTHGRNIKESGLVQQVEINVETNKTSDRLTVLKPCDADHPKSLVDVNKDAKKLLSRFLYQSGCEISPAVKTALQDIQCMLRRDDRYMAEVLHSAKVMDKIIGDNSVSGSGKRVPNEFSNKSPSRHKPAEKDLCLRTDNNDTIVESQSPDKLTSQCSIQSPLISKEPNHHDIARSLNVARETIL